MRSLGVALALGAVLLGWSELGFWARPRPGDGLLGFVQVWLAYSLAAFGVLVAAKRYGLRPWWRALLIGAAYGWFIEGVIVTTVYQELPFSVVWTGLGWHAPLAVLLGVATAGPLLATAGRTRVALGSLGAGVAAGLWSTTWWAEDGMVTSSAAVALWWAGTWAATATGYALLGRLDRDGWAPGRVAGYVGAGLAVVWLLAVTAALFWPAVLISPVLIAAPLLLLERRRPERRAALLLPRPVPWATVGVTALAPLAAGAAYSGAQLVGLSVPTWTVYVVANLTGLVLVVIATRRAWAPSPALVAAEPD